MKKYLNPALFLVVISIIFGTIYVVGQQILRMSAYDPQIQMAQDAAIHLDNGDSPGSVITPKVDASSSLAPFTIVYDKQGQAIAVSTYIGPTPIINIPYGVLQHTQFPYNSLTWAPEPNVQLATVVVKSHDFYVVSARSLTEVEKRESIVLSIAVLSWALTLLTGGVYVWLNKYMLDIKNKK